MLRGRKAESSDVVPMDGTFNWRQVWDLIKRAFLDIGRGNRIVDGDFKAVLFATVHEDFESGAQLLRFEWIHDRVPTVTPLSVFSPTLVSDTFVELSSSATHGTLNEAGPLHPETVRLDIEPVGLAMAPLAPSMINPEVLTLLASPSVPTLPIDSVTLAALACICGTSSMQSTATTPGVMCSHPTSWLENGWPGMRGVDQSGGRHRSGR